MTTEADNDSIYISVKSTMNHWRWWRRWRWWWWLFYRLRIKKRIAWMRKYWLRTLVSCTRSWISLLSWLLPIPWWYQRSHHLQKGGFFEKKIGEKWRFPGFKTTTNNFDNGFPNDYDEYSAKCVHFVNMYTMYYTLYTIYKQQKSPVGP